MLVKKRLLSSQQLADHRDHRIGARTVLVPQSGIVGWELRMSHRNIFGWELIKTRNHQQNNEQ